MSSDVIVTAPSVARLVPRNRVLPSLAVIAAVAAGTGGFLGMAPNRLVTGTPVPLRAAVGAPFTAALAVAAALLFALGYAPARRGMHYLAAAISGATLAAVVAAAGSAAAMLAIGALPAVDISLGSAFWVAFACSSLALIDSLQRAEAGPPVQLAVVAIAAALFFVAARAGVFDALALAREYASRRDSFDAAVVRHIELVAAALLPALVIGVPLGIAALRHQRFETPLFVILNLLQTVPSIALFGLLIAPLSGLANAVPALAALGVGGVGPAPAIIALIVYALLPIARNTLAGIAGVPPGAIDAAYGMGMTKRQVFWQVEVPLALPVLLAGLRIVTVQTIGLTVVAALIGAGGLGSFVFQGLGQYATDLVLLGALPAIAMALAADFLLRLAARLRGLAR